MKYTLIFHQGKVNFLIYMSIFYFLSVFIFLLVIFFKFDLYSFFKDANKRHPGHDMLYEYHSNQSGDPDNVLVHCLGHWRLTQLFHDLVFHPKIVVYFLLPEKRPNLANIFTKYLTVFFNNNIFTVKYFKFRSQTEKI